jgi:MFS family permease
MIKRLLVLFFCLFLVMIGFGVTLPVFAFYTERLAIQGGATREVAVMHVGLLTGLYALMQFLFGALVGPRWTKTAGVDWDRGFCDRAGAVRIGELPVVVLRRADHRRHPLGGNVSRGNGLRGRFDL